MSRKAPHTIWSICLPALLVAIVIFQEQLHAGTGHSERPGDCTAVATLNLNNWLGAPLLSPRVLENAVSHYTPGTAFAPTVSDHKLTPGPIPSACVSPNGKNNYLQTDPTVYQWTLINGGNVGDVIQWQFFAPGAATPYSQQQTTLNFSGAACFWAGINIAGQTAASLPGTWQVKVIYNGSLLLTENFTINSSLPTVGVSDHRVSLGPIPASCVPPTLQTNFLATDPQVYEWILFTGIQAGDVIRWEFVQPNGTLYQAQEFSSTFSGSSGCFWSSIAIAGQTAATLPGNWQVKVYYNAVLKQTDNFVISAISCPSVSSLSPASAAAGTAIQINGSNLSAVTAVKFTGNANAVFSVLSSSQLSVTVPPGAASGPITLSSSGCADVQTPAFTLIPNNPVPSISSLSPTSAIAGGGSFTLTVTGVNFVNGATLRWNGSDRPTTFVNATSLSAVISAADIASSGTASITVFNPAPAGGVSIAINFTINAPCPAGVTASPTSGSIGTLVTITGTNLNGVTAVKFGGAVSVQFTIISNTQISARVPVGANNGAITVSKSACTDVQTGIFTVLQPQITVGQNTLNFGSVTVFRNLDRQLSIQNTGNATLTINSLISSNLQYNIIGTTVPLSIAAGAQQVLTVRFAPGARGDQPATLSIKSNDPVRPQVDVPLTGKGVAPVITATPGNLAFGNVATNQRASLSLMLKNVGDLPLNVTSLTSSDPQFAISAPAAGFGLPAGATTGLNVTFLPTSSGVKNALLTLASNDPITPQLTIALSGTGQAPVISTNVSSLAFGSVKLAQTQDLVLTVSNTGQLPLKISGLSISNTAFFITQLFARPANSLQNLPLEVAPGNFIDVTIRFRPGFNAASIGPLSGILSISSNDPVRPVVSIPLGGTGLGALISAPALVSFPSVTACAGPASASVTVTNSGNAPLTVNQLTLDQAAFNFTSRPPLPLTIAAGASSTIGLSFASIIAGNINGNLTISSNAANSQVVRLSGNTVAPVTPATPTIAVSRTTLSHGRANETRGFSVFNPFGLSSVIGFAFPGAMLPARSISPGALPTELFTTIALSPDPMHVTLSGGVSNPIVLSAANLPSSFTLAVAEGVSAPNTTKWDRIGSRFGSGNLYAAVSIPGSGITAGQELVTDADLDAYTANSIVYEAPAFGLVVAPSGQSGGTATLQARARFAPPDSRCQKLFSSSAATQIEYARTVRVDILPGNTQIIRSGGALQVTVAARISGNFDPAANTEIRFALKLNGSDIITDVDEVINPPDAQRITTHTFIVPTSEECQLAELTVVASSTGNVPFAPPPLNPFLDPAPESVGLFTFRSGGSTVEDVQSVLLKSPESNCGNGIPVGWINGVVYDQSTGEPIGGAVVSIAGTGLSATTSDDGSYSLNNVPAGTQALTASAPGFKDSQFSINVTAGQVATHNFQLTPYTGAVSGTVINGETLQPVSGASITVKGTAIATTSRQDGTYTLANVPIGTSSVIAAAGGFEADEELVTVYADQTATEDFYLIPETGSIIGYVFNSSTFLPVPGAQVAAGGITGITIADGTYLLNRVPAGNQTVTVSATGYTSANASAIVSDGQTVTVNLALTPQNGTITGVIKDPQLNPIAGAVVTLIGAPGTLTTGADGVYTFTNVPPGTQTISATANGYHPGSDTVSVQSNLTSSKDIILGPIGGALKGTITDSVSLKALSGATVEVLPFPISFGTSDATGAYTMGDVAPGQQVVLASAPGYFAKLAVVAIVANATTVQDFALVPKVGSLQGIVFDKNAQPVSGALLTVTDTGEVTTSGPDGFYSFTNVSALSHPLSVSRVGYITQSFSVTVVTNETVYKDIYLDTPTGSIQGNVKDSVTGQPVVGASILIGIPFGAVYYSAFTDSAGNYTISDVKAGSVTIYSGADGYSPAQATLTVLANQTVTQNFVLVPDITTTTGSISGVIRSSASGNPPVSGAQVAVSGTSLTATSGGDGTYTLSGVSAGTQTLNVTKAGYQSATGSVVVVAGQNATKDFIISTGGGTVTGVVRNAANANPLSGATVTVAGTNLSNTSGADGVYTLSNVPTGSQTLNVTATGFIAGTVPIAVTDGQTVTQNISLSPTLPPGEIRITLNWQHYGGSAPNDLDMHLIGPNPDGSCFEINFTNLGSLSAAPFALLEVDNVSRSVCPVSGNCPTTETMHIGKLSPGVYRFYVVNYGNEDPDGLSRSTATVQVIGSSGTLGSYTVPGGTGRTWTVFEIDGTSGAIKTINQLASPASGCK